MRKKNSMIRWTRMLVLAVAVSISIYGIAASNLSDSDGPRSDIIIIDTLKTFGSLEKPDVLFLHDRHTRSLEKYNKDCTACHMSEENFDVIPETLKTAARRVGRLSPKFKRLKDAGRKDVMNVYHDNCIDCHKEMKGDGEQTGPVICAGCHMESPGIESDRTPMEMDKSLHYRHVKSQDKKCEQCHHEYDEEKQKLYYEKGKESSCRYCHKETSEENRVSMKLASHLQCIRCHRATLAEKKEAGPVECAGCHAPGRRAEIEKVEEVPRIERNQPDYTIVQTGLKTTEKDRETAIMDPVPFNHKGHEQRNESCRVCHHAALDQCSKCHTIRGSTDGNGIKLESAMHLSSTEQSCIGCHTIKQKAKNCAGCHAPMVKERTPRASCEQCHMSPPEGMMKDAAGQQDIKAVAKAMLDARSSVSAMYPDEDIPEKVVIDAMTDQYEAVEMPHRKMVKVLAAGIEDNKLAAYFHKEQGTVCQGCHHNSPESKTPPRCINCHGGPFNKSDHVSPGLKAAYHQQCMGCHELMELKKPEGCTSCHKEKQPLQTFK